MSEMSLEEQIRCMKEMRAYLDDFCKLMQQEMDKLQNDIKYLRSQGFSKEEEETYQKNYYAPANSEVERVVNDIRQRHFGYIDKVVEHLEKALNEQ